MVVLITLSFLVTISFVLLRQSTFPARILGFKPTNLTPKLFSLKLFLASVCCVLFVARLYFIYKQGGVIPNEIIGPQNYTSKPSDTALLKEIVTTPSIKMLNHCSAGEAKQLRLDNESLYFYSQSRSFDPQRNKWLSLNDFSLSSLSTRRGGFIHHYNTILYPFRELRAGNWREAITSQYGFSSIVPLLLIKKGSPFSFYQFVSLLLLLPLFFLHLNTLKKLGLNSSLELLLFLTGIALISIDQWGFLISPGFSIFRFLPFILLFHLVGIISLGHRLTILQCTFFIMLLFINSAPLNTFISAVLLFGLAFQFKKNKSIYRQYLVLLVLTFIVLGFQFATQLAVRNIFTPMFFSSLKDASVSFSWIYGAILILPFLISAILRSYFSKKPISLSEFLSYVAVGLCLTYCLSFPGSPLHYFGFLMLTLFPQTIIFTNLINHTKFRAVPPTILVLLVILLCLPAYRYRNRPNPIGVCTPSYLASIPYGRTLSFSATWNLRQLNDDLTNFLGSFNLSLDRVALLTKDKGFVELYQDKNLEPKSYDSYLNTDRSIQTKLVQDLERKQIFHFVVDSPTHSMQVADAVDFFSMRSEDQSNRTDASSYKTLLEIHQSFTQLHAAKNLGCTPRWCLFSLETL